MPINGLKLSDITLDDIQNLIDTQEREGSYLEYKLELPNFKNADDKFEFLHDVSAFANASGGDIIYGIGEKRDNKNLPTAIPTKIVGLAVSNKDHAQRQIESIITSNLQPILRGVQFHWIDLEEGKTILILRTPRSWVRPHAVPINAEYRVSIRTASGKNPLSFKEIGDMIIGSSILIDKIKAFREMRIELLKAGDLGIFVRPSAVIFQMIPADAFERGNRFPAQFLKNTYTKQSCLPLGFVGGNHQERYNFDGALYALYDSKPEIITQVQYFRNGIIESINNNLFGVREEKLWFSSSDLEDGIINAFKQYLDLQNCLGITLPIYVLLSLIGVKGALITWETARFGQNPDPIDRDNLILPELIVDSYQVDPATFLKPAFDSIWNSADLPRSMNYDEKGNRVKR